ncbi:MAG TPA: hypothetical protein VIY08_16245 [Candidatus Nitrosocosmicus sp.]
MNREPASTYYLEASDIFELKKSFPESFEFKSEIDLREDRWDGYKNEQFILMEYDNDPSGLLRFYLDVINLDINPDYIIVRTDLSKFEMDKIFNDISIIVIGDFLKH